MRTSLRLLGLTLVAALTASGCSLFSDKSTASNVPATPASPTLVSADRPTEIDVSADWKAPYLQAPHRQAHDLRQRRPTEGNWLSSGHELGQIRPRRGFSRPPTSR